MSGSPTIVRDAQLAQQTFLRIAARYLGEKRARVYPAAVANNGLVLIRLVPGRLRTWDFADEYALSGNIAE